MAKYLFYMVLFFCFSGVAGAVIYLHFFKNECKENHIKYLRILYNVLIVMACLLMIFGAGEYFRQLLI